MRHTNLYRLLLALVIGMVASADAQAQTDYRTKATGMLSVGAGFAGGASMALQPPDGFKYKPSFAWRLTADATYPLNPTVAAMLSLGLDNRGFRSHPQADADAWQDLSFSYFSIFPAFRLSAFTLGVNFGFPMGATINNFNGTSEDFEEDNPRFGTLNTMIEPRLGVTIPVLDEDIGWLGVTVGGGIVLSEPWEPNIDIDTDMNNQLVSAHLGLTWQFGIKGTGRR